MAGAAPLASGDFAPAVINDELASPEDDIPTDIKRWLAYQELLKVCTDNDPKSQVKQLEMYLDGLQQQCGTEEGDFAPAAADNIVQRIRYGGQLLTTVLTEWEDNPVPGCIYLLDVSKSGKWGGKNHSLEVGDSINPQFGMPCTTNVTCFVMCSWGFDAATSTQTAKASSESASHSNVA